MLEIGVCFAHRKVLVQHLEESPEVRGAPITMRALPLLNDQLERRLGTHEVGDLRQPLPAKVG
ncbi:hypothetical protein BH18ACT3_BH18ACT3_25680 [soil metagenome]